MKRQEAKALKLIRENINDWEFLRGVLGGTLDALHEEAPKVDSTNLQTELAGLIQLMVEGSRHCRKIKDESDLGSRSQLVACAKSGIENAIPLAG